MELQELHKPHALDVPGFDPCKQPVVMLLRAAII